MADYLLANGKSYSWGNVTIMPFGSSILIGVTDISYERKRVSKVHYGAGNEPVSEADGNYEYPDGSITVYTEELRAIAASAPGGSILNIPRFPTVVMLSGDGVNFTTDTIKNMKFLNDPFSTKQGDTAIMCKINFSWAGLDHK